jgi:hypothetical protein
MGHSCSNPDIIDPGPEKANLVRWLEFPSPVEKREQLIGKPACGKTCEAIQGIVAEGKEIAEEYKGSLALDAGLISSAQGCRTLRGRPLRRIDRPGQSSWHLRKP